jgi:hypothetical protein
MTIRSLLSISDREVSFAYRGFPDHVPGVRQHLERAGGAFVNGYNAALRYSATPALTGALHALPRDLHGFAYEGASMALTLLDSFTPWARTRWRWLVEGDGAPHVYLCFVGAGWALARLHLRRLPRWIARVDPVLAQLAFDGYGFHQAFFHPLKYVRRQKAPRMNSQSFDPGLGRALWFVEGADPDRIAAAIARFPRERQPDLWSGAGLAFAYAGGVSASAAHLLWDLADLYRAELAQGVAFAAKARHRAGNVSEDTELACSIAWGADADEVAGYVDTALETARRVSGNDVFGRWRRLLTIDGGREIGDAVPPLKRPFPV